MKGEVVLFLLPKEQYHSYRYKSDKNDIPSFEYDNLFMTY